MRQIWPHGYGPRAKKFFRGINPPPVLYPLPKRFFDLPHILGEIFTSWKTVDKPGMEKTPLILLAYISQ